MQYTRWVTMKHFFLLALLVVPVGCAADLALTPPMGWNSWNKFAEKVDDKAVRAMADAIVSNGMKDAGYVYVNIDDTWEAGRDAQGNIQSNEQVSRHEGAGRLRPQQGAEDRHLLFARAEDLRGLRGKLPTRGAGREDLGGLGHRLFEVRLVQRRESLQAFRHAGRLQEDGRRAEGDRPAHRLQPVPVRPAECLGVGRFGGRQSVAHHRRHRRQLEEHVDHRFRQADRATTSMPSPDTGTIRTCSKSATAA